MSKAILTADIHIRETQPICRLDDFAGKTQWDDLAHLCKLQSQYDCPVFNAGDLFDHWKNTNWLITKVIEYLPDSFFTVYGDHDQPGKNMELIGKSSIETLRVAGRLEVIDEGNWRDTVHDGFRYSKRNVAVMHRFAWDGKEVPWPGCEESTAQQILDEYPQFDLIVTGDHHKGFVHRGSDGRLLVNPGCFNIQDAKYIGYKPRVYLWESEDNSVETIYLPVLGEYSREHRDREKENEQKLNAIVERIREDIEEAFDSDDDEVSDTLKRYFQKHKTQQITQQIIYKALEEIK